MTGMFFVHKNAAGKVIRRIKISEMKPSVIFKNSMRMKLVTGAEVVVEVKEIKHRVEVIEDD